MTLHEKQREVIKSDARFKVIRAGRRSGKSTLEIEDMCFQAVSGKDRPIFYIAPTQKQARSIIWESLKARLGGIGSPNESRLEMKVPTKDGGFSTIEIAGWENRENFRGRKAWKIYFDEVDTMKDFFIGWQEIFRPALIDFSGGAMFCGTPKKENPNLRRLEKISETDSDFKGFHFTSLDNPFLEELEKVKARDEMDKDTYKQEILAEYVDNAGSLFKYTALIDMFSNTVVKNNEKYLIVDVADDGSDKTVFSFWNSLEMYRVDVFERLNTEGIINQTREFAAQEQIPYSQIAVDAIGVGAGVASSSLLDGIVGYKSSHQAIKTDADIVRLPNVHYTDKIPLTSEYKNLRSQCVFTLAGKVNNHEIAVRCSDIRIKEKIIEELALYQDVSSGDGKRMATTTEDIKTSLGRSPDIASTFIMRMYFEIRNQLAPNQSEEKAKLARELESRFMMNKSRQGLNSAK